jgi:hypothetical protein
MLKVTPAMPARHDTLHHALCALLALLAASSLACAAAAQNIERELPPDPKIEPESAEDQDSPQHAETPQPAEGAPAQAADAPTSAAVLSPEEIECEQASRPLACLRFAHEALRAQDPQLAPRAAMALSYACELDSGRGCYEYALVTWWGVGVAYQAAEIEYGFKRARELGEPMAQRGFETLLKGPATEGFGQDRDALFHQGAACALGIVAACEQPKRPSPVPEPIRPKPQPAQPTSPQPKSPSTVLEPVKPTESAESAKPVEPVKPAASSIKQLDLKVSGGLTRDQAQITVRKGEPEIVACYEAALKSNPKLAGKIVAQLGIDESGQVRGLRMDQSTLGDDEALLCMYDAISSWRFEPSQNKMSTVVVYSAELNHAASR